MSPRWLCAVGCGLALAPIGCFWLNTYTPKRVVGRTLPDVPAPDVGATDRVTFNTRLVEQPVGRSYLTGQLWTDVTDPLPHHLSALLAVNGLRVGVMSGRTPAEFDQLASGESTAVAPTVRHGLAGKPKVIPVNGPLERCSADVTDTLTADPRAFSWTAAECGLVATGTPHPSGGLTVRVQFQVQHGDKRAWWTPTADGGFDRTDERTRESYPALTFEVPLDPKDVLVIGPTAEPGGTLGGAYFVTADQMKQRVLVVRASAER
jgi:hypothetical protein